MLKQLSWTSYFEIVIFLAAIYYLFVLLIYYRKDALQLLQSKQAAPGPEVPKVPDVLRYEPAEHVEEINFPAGDNKQEDLLNRIEKEDFDVADKFIGELRSCIKNASGKPFSPAILIPQIRKLLRDNPDLRDSPQRSSINELIVQECESTGTALLTEDEVDQWWDD